MNNKQKDWDSLKRKIDNMGDSLGKGLDEGIKETVIVLNLLGLNTVGSCEGHPGSQKWSEPSPWVDVKAPGKPVSRWIDEDKIWNNTAKNYGLPLEDIKSGKNRDVWLEAYWQMEKKGETKEFKKWFAQSEILKQKLQGYLDEFYKKRKAVPTSIALTISPYDVATFRVEGSTLVFSGPQKNWEYPKNKYEEKNWDAILKKRQNEMAAFTIFLKNKYLQS